MSIQGRVLEEVVVERAHQDNKWGITHNSDARWLAILMEEVGEVA